MRKRKAGRESLSPSFFASAVPDGIAAAAAAQTTKGSMLSLSAKAKKAAAAREAPRSAAVAAGGREIVVSANCRAVVGRWYRYERRRQRGHSVGIDLAYL